MRFSTAFHVTQLSAGLTCKDVSDSFTMKMQIADMYQICKKPLSHATVLTSTDAADLKGTDAAATSLWSLDVFAVPLRTVAWPQLKVGFSSVAGQCIKAPSQAQPAEQQAHPVVSTIIDSMTLKSSLGIVGSHRVWILYERLHSREIQSELWSGLQSDTK